jgi:hypothetical protein
VIFNTVDSQSGTVQAGKCALCHFNAGANISPSVFGNFVAQFGFPKDLAGNNVFSTNTNSLSVDAAAAAPGVAGHDAGFGVLPMGLGDCLTGSMDISGPFPVFNPDPPGNEPGGFGGHGVAPFIIPNLCMEQFNTPPLIEAADTPPFFHNNGANTIEDAVAFYNSAAFNNDPIIRLFVSSLDSGKLGIQLNTDSVAAVASFLRVLNALENLRQSTEFDQAALSASDPDAANQLVSRALDELNDAQQVLTAVNLAPAAVQQIAGAIGENKAASAMPSHNSGWQQVLTQAIAAMGRARTLVVTDLP